eukprot:tig00000093_g3542.t1
MLKINWELVGTPERERACVDFLNESFRKFASQKPDVLGDLKVESVCFGSTPPVFKILAVSTDLPPDRPPAGPRRPREAGDESSRRLDGAAAGFPRSPSQDSLASAGSTDHFAGAFPQGLSGLSVRSGGSAALGRDPEHSLAELRLELGMEYDGDARIAISTDFRVNVPIPEFLKLPLAVSIDKLTFRGTLVVEYCGDSISVYFREDREGPEAGPLKELAFGIGIGADPAVLKNKDKIESFISFFIRKIIREQLVYPNRLVLPLELLTAAKP